MKNANRNILIILKILTALYMTSVPVSAQEKALSDYSNDDRELVFYMMLAKLVCDVYVPGFEAKYYEKYNKWLLKYKPLAEEILSRPEYKKRISNIYENPNSMPVGEELTETCLGVSQNLDKINE